MRAASGRETTRDYWRLFRMWRKVACLWSSLPDWLTPWLTPALVLALLGALWRARRKCLWYLAVIWDRGKLVKIANDWMALAESERQWGEYWERIAKRCETELERMQRRRDGGRDSGDGAR